MAEPIDESGQDPLLLQLKLKAQSRMREEQASSGMSNEEWQQKEREKWRWSAGMNRGLLQSAADLAGDFNTGLVSLLGPTVQDALAEIGIGRRTNTDPLMGIAGRGAEVAGSALALAGGLGFMLTRGAVKTGVNLATREAGGGGLATQVTRGLSQGIEKSPGAFFGSELAGGFGAGSAEEAVRQTGDTSGVTLAGLAGGTAGGIVPIVGLNFTRQASNWALMNLAPWTDAGGSLFAARRLQSTAKDPTKAAEKALKGRSGVSAARRTEDADLLALEARVFLEDPTMALEFDAALTGAMREAQRELRTEVGELRLPGDWEQSVIQSVAVPGTIIPKGDVHKMMERAYESFTPLYKDFAGYPVRAQIETDGGELPLQQVFKISISDPSIVASKSERRAALGVVKDEFTRIKGALTEDDTVDSDVILTVRQNIRDKMRILLASKDRGNHITANILSNVDTTLTTMLHQQLPDSAMQTMSQIDRQYNKYQVVQAAVNVMGDKVLSPQALSNAVKQAPSGQADNMRRLARAGRDVESVIGDPHAARNLVRGQDVKTSEAIRSDFLDVMWRKSQVRQVAEDGTQLVSGRRFLSNLVGNKETATALGITGEKYNRMVHIARELQAMEMKNTKQIDKLLIDGPANILELGAALSGVHTAGSVKPSGPGALVVAGFFAGSARRLLTTVFKDNASRILIAAHRDPELYAALLVKPTDPVKVQNRAAETLHAWMYSSGESAMEDDQ